jgi:outer membrane immunogenic protein
MNMRKIAIVAALAACAGSAQAADLGDFGGLKDAPVASSWTGFYIGVNGGGVAGDTTWNWGDFVGTTSLSSQLGGTAGGQVGYNYQFAPHGVAGVEGSFAWISAQGTGAENPSLPPVSNDITKFNGFLGDISGRLGYADDRVFVYGKAGAAWADRTLSGFYGAGSPFNGSATASNVGWLAGAGVELKLLSNWTAKVEWNHIDFGANSENLGNAGILNKYEQTLEVFKVGVNYKLGSYGYEPMK